MTRARLADLVGAGLALLVAAAVVVSAWVNGAGDPVPMLVTLTIAVCAYVVGRLLAPFAQAAAVLPVVALAVIVVVSPYGLWAISYGPLLGYANANAALYVQATALVAIAALAATSERWRTLSLLVAGGLILLVANSGSLAGFLTELAVVGALFVTLNGSPRRRLLLTACVSLVLVAHLAVFVLGSTYRPEAESSGAYTAVASSLSERRLALWSDAVSIAVENPLSGVGPRQFPVTSPTARADADTRETHSATLQMAAETGWVGAVALLALLLWAVARPWAAATDEGVTGGAVVASTAATALAVHSTVDYVLQFPAVVATAALVVGAGSASVRSAGRVAR